MALKDIIRTLCLLIFCFGSAAVAQQVATDVLFYEASGQLGKYQIRLDIAVQNHDKFISAHYFYAMHTTDVPLTGEIDGEQVTLVEPEGAVFRLHLVTNGSTKWPFDFFTATGLMGVWTKGNVSMPVSLQFDLSNEGYDGTGTVRRYADVTSESDAAFEERAAHFIHGATSGNRKEAAAAVSFPLTVITKPPMKIRNSSSLFAQWGHIFTAKYLAELRNAFPHKMGVLHGMAYLANGDVWFDAKGATTLIPPE